MKSVGEAMGIGRTFREAFWKAMRSRELDAGAVTPWADLDDLPEASTRGSARELERLRDEGPPTGQRVYRRVDSCAGEVAAESNYYYSTFGEADEAPPTPDKPRVVILGSGPNRIGQGIEFDYCCVHAAQSFRALGYEAVMVNCNPETVSTDYDTSDRLYFEPLDAEEVLAVCEREQPEGVVHPVRRPDAAEARARDRGRRLPDPRHAVRRDRPRRGPRALRRAARAASAIRCPEWGIAASGRRGGARSRTGSATRCSCGPPTCSAGARCASATAANEVVEAFRGDLSGTVLVDRFLENAIEIDVDALCDGEETYVAAVMQHVEEAGVHSGDSACVLPAPSLTSPPQREVERRRARGSGRRSASSACSTSSSRVADGDVYVLEVEPARVADGAVRVARRPASTSSTPRAGSPRARSSPSSALPAERAAGAGRASRRRCCRSRASPAPTRCSGRRCARPAR